MKSRQGLGVGFHPKFLIVRDIGSTCRQPTMICTVNRPVVGPFIRVFSAAISPTSWNTTEADSRVTIGERQIHDEVSCGTG